MLNIKPNVWVNPDAIEELQFEKNSLEGDKLYIYLISGRVHEIVENINDIMREIEREFESKTSVDAKPKKEKKPRKKQQVLSEVDKAAGGNDA